MFAEAFLCKCAVYLENELFIEDGLQRVSEDFSFTRFGFVGQDVDFDVWIGASSQVHGLQRIGFFNPHDELEGKNKAVVQYSETVAVSPLAKTRSP